VLALLAALLLLAGCSHDDSSQSAQRSPSASVTSSATPAPPTTPTPVPGKPSKSTTPKPKLDTWRVGARPLPLRPDGYGQVLPTPKQLRVRLMPTRDLLPPPRDGHFHATVAHVSPVVRKRMGKTWSPQCPVPLSALRYLTLSFRGFDGRAHTGELVVSASVARDVVTVFHRLYDASYPIEEMRLPTTADLDAPPTGDGNNTAAYVCRATRGASTFSAHAYGIAIDVNPFINPYQKGDLVLPELASAYLDRSWRRPGMILPGGVVRRAFAAVGWQWGGDFQSLSDRMHFSANGR
jgi:D-alanyl-D-alanine carboxypeptidase